MSTRPSPVAPTPGFEATRRRVEAIVLDFLASERRALGATDVRAAALVEEIERTVRAGGKRLRPLFCVWGHRAAGGSVDDERILRAAGALELLHTFAIVQDDVMDRSLLRRGQPPSYRRLEGSLAGASGAARFGLSAATLVGDLAAAFADRLFHRSGFSGEALDRAAGVFHQMRAEVIAGQYLDVLAASRGEVTAAEARRIAALKSGGYTVEKPLLIGACLAGGSDDLLARLSAFGAPLGEAFQLRDDVLGAFGDPEVTGKDADSDFREGKPTLLVALALERASREDRRFLSARLGAPDLSADEAERIREIVRGTGALRGTLSAIDDLIERARLALRAAPLAPVTAGALAELADLAAYRDR